MNTVRAKFNCTSVDPYPTIGEKQGEQIRLDAVYSGATNAEDNTFAAATPNATVTKTVNNPACWGFFVVGKQYYADFTPAE